MDGKDSSFVGKVKKLVGLVRTYDKVLDEHIGHMEYWPEELDDILDWMLYTADEIDEKDGGL